ANRFHNPEMSGNLNSTEPSPYKTFDLFSLVVEPFVKFRCFLKLKFHTHSMQYTAQLSKGKNCGILHMRFGPIQTQELSWIPDGLSGGMETRSKIALKLSSVDYSRADN
ncbi:MAG: hypothetical protein J0L82_07200, partial [Deltaproteobacteria bacterium]|nr:hypothetical protein [Deltaproteobacteria bacterium]